MPMGTNEMLESLNAAIRDTPWWARWRPALILTLRTSELFGEYGHQLSEGEAEFGFTRAQCKRMRSFIRRAVRDDLRAMREAAAVVEQAEQ
jgi:hypothetical protein